MRTFASEVTTDSKIQPLWNQSSDSSNPLPPLKVLISAYSCQPDLGSEPGVGWNTVVQIARRHEVWVLTAAEQRQAIEQKIAQYPMPNVHWSFVEVPDSLTRFWKKGERGRRIHYGLWQYWAYLEGKRLQQSVSFDIIHHITFVSYWTPSYLSLLDVPFVWGPIGGGDGMPLAFYPTLSWKSKRSELLRDGVRTLAENLDPFVRKTAAHAAVALPTTEGTAAKVRRLGARDIRITSDIALARADIEALSIHPIRHNDAPFRVVSLGRFLGWKGFHLGIQAFAEFKKVVPASEYWMIGTGPEAERLQALAHHLGVADSVHFLGLVPREEALQRLAQADVLLHPSLHDTGSWVCLEGMAAGLAVVCLKLGGPATLVTDKTGFRVPANTPAQAIHDLYLALTQLARDPDLRLQMGIAGRERIHEYFDWDRKSEQFDRIYRELVKV